MTGPRAWAGVGHHPALLLGRAQHGWPVRPLLPVRRRSSGGGAVLSGPWLLWGLLRLPRTHPVLQQGPARAARWFGGVHRDWLQAQGVAAAMLYEGPVRDHWACFGGLGPGEVLVQGRKLTGIAQTWRRAHVLLCSGTLVATPPWPLLCDALGRPQAEGAELAACTVSTRECLLQAPPSAAWARSLAAALLDAAQVAGAASGSR